MATTPFLPHHQPLSPLSFSKPSNSTETIKVDKETINMLMALGIGENLGFVKVNPVPVNSAHIGFGRPGVVGGPARRY